MVSWDKEQFKNDHIFKIKYRYNGSIGTATVDEVRLSFGTIYRLKNDKHSWNLQKKETGWEVTSPRQMPEDLLKAIGEGIDAVLATRKF